MKTKLITGPRIIGPLRCRWRGCVPTEIRLCASASYAGAPSTWSDQWSPSPTALAGAKGRASRTGGGLQGAATGNAMGQWHRTVRSGVSVRGPRARADAPTTRGAPSAPEMRERRTPLLEPRPGDRERIGRVGGQPGERRMRGAAHELRDHVRDRGLAGRTVAGDAALDPGRGELVHRESPGDSDDIDAFEAQLIAFARTLDGAAPAVGAAYGIAIMEAIERIAGLAQPR